MTPRAIQEPPTEGPRFEFGANWSSFARDLDPARLAAARRSLAEMVGREALEGASFLDIGSGSGIFSLAASELGAERVLSFDYDPDSVATTLAVKGRFAPGAAWTVERGDVLDSAYLEGLGQWDVVYSWGVLHHTGDMWRAIEGACARVRQGGRLFIAIYNDQGAQSRAWAVVKRFYQVVPRPLRTAYAVLAALPIELRALAGHIRRREVGAYVRSWRTDASYSGRGMNRKHDLIDWVGGYPFEYATPEAIFAFCRDRGFELRRLVTVGGSHGCNEFVFERVAVGDAP